MQVHDGFAPIVSWSNELDGDAVRVGAGTELRVAAKATDIGLYRENRRRPPPYRESGAWSFLFFTDDGPGGPALSPHKIRAS